MKHALVICDPPHVESPDYMAVASLFGVAAGEVRMLTAYPAAEPWFVETDKATLDEKLSALRSAGFAVQVVSFDQLAALPEAKEVRELEFQDSALLFKGSDVEASVPYAAPLVVVYAKPVLFGAAAEKHADDRTKSGKRKSQTSKQDSIENILGDFGVIGALAGGLAAHAIEDPKLTPNLEDPTLLSRALKEEYKEAFIDFYSVKGKEFSRFRLPIATFRAGCLGEAASGNLVQDIEYILRRCTESFSHCEMDRRLFGASCRDAKIEMKPFSRIAAEFSESLAGASKVELASRLCAMASLRRLAQRSA